MKSSINLVQEFHEIFDHEISSKPKLPDSATLSFRVNFIAEELKELEESVKNGDIVGLADALGDIQYVLDGFFLNCGLHNHKDKILEAIHASNMTKVCINETHANETQNLLHAEGVETYCEPVGEYFIVKRKSDGKVMKATGYQLPKIKELLSESEVSNA